MLSQHDLSYIAPYESRLFLNGELTDFVDKSKNAILRNKRLKRNVNIFSALGLILLLAAVSYYQYKQYLVTRSNELAAYSFLEVEQDPTLSFRLAEKAYEIDPGYYAESALLKSFSEGPFYTSYEGDEAEFTEDDSKLIISNQLDSSYKIVDLLTGKKIEIKTNTKGQLFSESCHFSDYFFTITSKASIAEEFNHTVTGFKTTDGTKTFQVKSIGDFYTNFQGNLFVYKKSNEKIAVGNCADGSEILELDFYRMNNASDYNNVYFTSDGNSLIYPGKDSIMIVDLKTKVSKPIALKSNSGEGKNVISVRMKCDYFMISNSETENTVIFDNKGTKVQLYEVYYLDFLYSEADKNFVMMTDYGIDFYDVDGTMTETYSYTEFSYCKLIEVLSNKIIIDAGLDQYNSGIYTINRMNSSENQIIYYDRLGNSTTFKENMHLQDGRIYDWNNIKKFNQYKYTILTGVNSKYSYLCDSALNKLTLLPHHSFYRISKSGKQVARTVMMDQNSGKFKIWLYDLNGLTKNIGHYANSSFSFSRKYVSTFIEDLKSDLIIVKNIENGIEKKIRFKREYGSQAPVNFGGTNVFPTYQLKHELSNSDKYYNIVFKDSLFINSIQSDKRFQVSLLPQVSYFSDRIVDFVYKTNQIKHGLPKDKYEFSSNDSLLFVINRNGNIIGYSTHDEKNIKEFITLNGNYIRIDVSSDGKFIAAMDSSNLIHVFQVDGDTYSLKQKFNKHENSVITAMEFSPDNKHLLTSSLDSTFIISRLNGEIVHEQKFSFSLIGARFYKYSKFIKIFPGEVEYSNDSIIYFYKESVPEVHYFQDGESFLFDKKQYGELVDVSSDGKRLLTANWTSGIYILDNYFRELLFIPNDKLFTEYRISDDGRFLLLMSERNIRKIPLYADVVFEMVYKEKIYGNFRELSQEEKEKYGLE